MTGTKLLFYFIFSPFILLYNLCLLGFIILIYSLKLHGDLKTIFASENPLFYQNKVIWITGASSGIGKALAKQLTSWGAYLIISSRKKKMLENLKNKYLLTLNDQKPKVAVLPLDLLELKTLRKKGRESLKCFGCIDILINNGGISTRTICMNSNFEDVDIKIMKINHLGAVALTKAILPHMIKRKRGAFINVSSTAGKIGCSFRSAYCSSKWAMLGFFESLRVETSFLNVRIMNVCPGFIQTNVAKNALGASGKECGKDDPNILTGISTPVFAKMMLNAFTEGIEECWIAKGKTLCLMYLYNYSPTVCRYIVSREFRSLIKEFLFKKKTFSV